MRALFVLLLLPAVGAAAQPLAPGYASANRNLRLRAAPSSSAHHVSSVPEGYPVQLGLCERGWCEVQYVGVRGFVPERHLTLRRQPLQARTANADLTARRSDTAEAEPSPRIGSAEPTQPPPPPSRAARAPDDDTRPEEADGRPADDATPPPATGPTRRTTPIPPLAVRVPSGGALSAAETDEPAAKPADMETLRQTADLSPGGARPEEANPSEAEAGTDESDVAPAYTSLTPIRTAPPTVIKQASRPCPAQLEQAERRYRDRAFGEALGLASRCLAQGNPTPEEAIPAYRLMSLVYAHTNEEAEAEQALLRLLAIDPTYEPDRPHDPLHYVALVSSVRRDLGLPASEYRCDWELAEAHGFYVTATFDRALQVLRVCLDKPDLRDTEAVWAYRLRALSHLRQSNLAEARQAVLAIVTLDPEYRADPVRDIPSYVALVNLVRQQSRDTLGQYH